MPKIPSHADSITFKVRANNDVHVALARQPYDQEDSPKIVEIVLGGWSNQESAIRDCQQCGDQTHESTPNLLSPDEDRHFNISFTDGYVQVGLVGEEPIMSHQFNPDEFQFNYLGISTGFGSTGNWTICNYIPTPIYLGCYIDAGDRALPNHLTEDHEEMTLEKCWAHCRSFGDQRYASLQYTYQCFCGSEYDDYGRHGQVSESDCSHQCNGNGRQYCGAGWRNSVYDLGGTSTIRLVGGDNSYTGRVELYDSGSWSSICGHGWDLTDSHVACKMLGYQGAEEFYTDATYGQGDGSILLNYVDCRGDENDLFECSHWGLYNHDCSHADDVAVKCNNWDRAVHDQHDEGNNTGTNLLIAFGVLSFLTFVYLLHRQKQLRITHNRHVTFGETFLVTFCGKQLSSPNTNTTSSQPNTVSGSVGTAQQEEDSDVEMPDVLPSYDVAITDSTPTNSDGGIVNSNFPPYNPDIYDASTIEDPSLPPPPSYDAVVAKSDEYQVPANR
ncbi:uncharacterized protein [Amphiura filiformis]|uniref:uncharacterized protein n=1 Tax=Amphiura filiformis TaxID=82378 RepID=UPI003B2239B6